MVPKLLALKLIALVLFWAGTVLTVFASVMWWKTTRSIKSTPKPANVPLQDEQGIRVSQEFVPVREWDDGSGVHEQNIVIRVIEDDQWH